jgi:hypothetical protein
MSNPTIVTEPVVLEGYQNFFKESKFGKRGLQAIVPEKIVDRLEQDREELLKWAKSKHKNPNRATVKVEPWESVSDGQYQVRFSWKPDVVVPIVDSEGTPIKEEIPLYSGSLVKLAFVQKPYTTPDSVGTRLVLKAVQVISCAGGAAVDRGDYDDTEAAALFGQTKGFKVGEPNVSVTTPVDDDDEF